MAQFYRPPSKLTAAQKTWSHIRPVFKTEFTAFSNDKLIIDGLAKLAHRPNENPQMFFSRLEEHIHILKENRVKPDRLAQQPQGGYSEDTLKKYPNDSMDNFANFMFTQMFKATKITPFSQRPDQTHSEGCIQCFLHGS
jgi:hypothetical protein